MQKVEIKSTFLQASLQQNHVSQHVLGTWSHRQYSIAITHKIWCTTGLVILLRRELELNIAYVTRYPKDAATHDFVAMKLAAQPL